MAITREWAKWDLWFLLRYLLRRTDCERPWIFQRVREVEASPDGFLDLWPRFHYKSTIITYALTIQEILRNPETTVAIFSHTRPIAKAFMRQIKREFESNDMLKLAFPDVLYTDPQKLSPKWSEDDGIIVKRTSNPKEATIEAWGLVDGMPTSKHYDLLLYDDIVTKDSVTNPEMVAKTSDSVRLSFALGHERSRKRATGTRYNYADSYSAFLDSGAFKSRIHHPTDRGADDIKAEGEPVLLNRERLQELRFKEMGEYVYACQMLQNPIAGSQAMFDVEDIQVYEVRPHTLNVFIMVDPARSQKKDSANTAMVVLGMDYAANKYLLDGYNHKMDLQDRWLRMRELREKWIREPGIQNVRVGYERYGAIADLDYFQEKMKVERQSFDIVELEWPRDGAKSKEDRVQRLGPDFRSHKFYTPYPTNPDKLTANQIKIRDGGHPYRISKSIRRKDNDGNIYDVSVQLKEQIHYFPFGGLKDLVDAASRIYDMDASPPVIYDDNTLEPEYT